MKFKPLHDRVVVERLDSDEKTAGGIIIPDSAQEKPMQGKILDLVYNSHDVTFLHNKKVFTINFDFCT